MYRRWLCGLYFRFNFKILQIQTYNLYTHLASLKIFLIYLNFKEKVIYFADYRFRNKSHNASSKIIIPYSKIKDT